jgi:hypothetical protein
MKASLLFFFFFYPPLLFPDSPFVCHNHPPRWDHHWHSCIRANVSFLSAAIQYYSGTNLLNNQQVAIKFEPRKSDAPQLRDEYRTYKILAGSSKCTPPHPPASIFFSGHLLSLFFSLCLFRPFWTLLYLFKDLIPQKKRMTANNKASLAIGSFCKGQWVDGPSYVFSLSVGLLRLGTGRLT